MQHMNVLPRNGINGISGWKLIGSQLIIAAQGYTATTLHGSIFKTETGSTLA